MTKKKKSRVILVRVSWWTTLLAGIAIGITSQKIPEIKSYTEEITRPIEQHAIFKDLIARISRHNNEIDSANQSYTFSQYTPNFALSFQPISSFVIHRPGYSLAYDARTRNPAWVYEHLTVENLKGDADRSHFYFKEDENIPPHLRATLADYKGQGLDQGHMAPAANHRSSLEAMSATFYLTNICPQCPQFNREYWSKLEKYARDLTKDYRNVYVVTGPLYLPYQEGKRSFVKYQVMGPNDVAVPSHFFKVLMLDTGNNQKEIKAYVLPNTFIPTDTPLDSFKTTIQKVEKAAGILLFNQSPPTSL
jgi:endonuclease G